MKGIVEVSMCYAAGAALGALFPQLQNVGMSGILLVICLLLSLEHIFCLYPALLFAGVGAGSAGMSMVEAGMVGSTSISEGFLYDCCERAKILIDNIPFEDSRANGLLKALLTADRISLSPEVTAAFRESGASHILALSGMHLGIIYTMLDNLLVPLGHRPAAKMSRSLTIVTASAAFTIMTGASASLVRAFLFILLKETASLTCRRADPVQVLCGSLTIQLAISPWNISKPGFQLSYLAMLGIFLLYPHLKALWPSGGFSFMRILWNSASLSISCQTLTAPVAWYHFSTFPVYFILTNLLALPLTTVLMFMAVPSVVLSALGICPGILLKVCSGLCSLLIKSLELVSSL